MIKPSSRPVGVPKNVRKVYELTSSNRNDKLSLEGAFVVQYQNELRS